MSNSKRLALLSLIVIIIVACNLPNSAPTDVPPPVDNVSATPTVTGVFTETATSTPVPVAACEPSLVTTTDSNVRNGPGQVYGILGQLLQGTTAKISGKNAEGTWWYIEFPAGPNGHGWIAGSITAASCVPTTLAIVAAPPTPILPSATPTLVPSSTPTGGLIFIPPILVFPLLPTATPTFVLLFPILPIVPIGP